MIAGLVGEEFQTPDWLAFYVIQLMGFSCSVPEKDGLLEVRKWKYEYNICHKRFSSIVNILSSSYFLTDWLLHTLEYRINKSKLSFHCRSRFQKEESISNLRILASTLETIYPEWSHYILSYQAHRIMWVFDRLINPIPTMSVHYAQNITTFPPSSDFQTTFLGPWTFIMVLCILTRLILTPSN